MAVLRRYSSTLLGSVATSKILSISSAETLYTVGTGNYALELTNFGVYNVYYGQSGVLVNSGGLIIPFGAKYWDGIVDDFTVYLVVPSGGVTSQVIALEYLEG